LDVNVIAPCAGAFHVYIMMSYNKIELCVVADLDTYNDPCNKLVKISQIRLIYSNHRRVISYDVVTRVYLIQQSAFSNGASQQYIKKGEQNIDQERRPKSHT
jgi:hypothetical protein